MWRIMKSRVITTHIDAANQLLHSQFEELQGLSSQLLVRTYLLKSLIGR